MRYFILQVVRDRNDVLASFLCTDAILFIAINGQTY